MVNRLFSWLLLLVTIFDLQTLKAASPASKSSRNLSASTPSASDKRERIFLGNGGFSLGFSKYTGGAYPFGGGGFGLGGSFLGGSVLGGHYHHNHAFGYGGGFSPALGYYGGLGGYNPYYSPSVGAGFIAGGGSYAFKHHHHHHGYPGYGHYNPSGYGGYGGFGYH